MRAVLLLSAALGVVWNLLAVWLMGGRLLDGLRPSWLLAGAIAGGVAGAFTVWSRRRNEGDETFLAGVATFYLGMLIYWASFVVIERLRLCWCAGGWTDFDLGDHVRLIAMFVFHGTVWYGIVLVPACFVSRRLVWALYERSA